MTLVNRISQHQQHCLAARKLHSLINRMPKAPLLLLVYETQLSRNSVKPVLIFLHVIRQLRQMLLRQRVKEKLLIIRLFLMVQNQAYFIYINTIQFLQQHQNCRLHKPIAVYHRAELLLHAPRLRIQPCSKARYRNHSLAHSLIRL